MSGIHKSIEHLATPLEKLVHLENNPRKGNIDAIVASYREFGQVKPIVIKDNPDGTSTIIAGNHQYEAAKKLGWETIACVKFQGDTESAIAYALADNRTNELGTTDSNMLFELLGEVGEQYDNLIDALGWDEFDLAAMEGDYYQEDDAPYEAPVIQPITPLTQEENRAPQAVSVQLESGETVLNAPQGTDTHQAVTQGAPSVVANGSKTIVQYTLVFDSPDQQRKWYDFIRWLKSDPGTDGETTAERVLNFVDAHANY
jgi:hypothetical protein